MTFLLWLYQFIGALFLGFMICTASDAKTKIEEWALILLLDSLIGEHGKNTAKSSGFWCKSR